MKDKQNLDEQQKEIIKKFNVFYDCYLKTLQMNASYSEQIKELNMIASKFDELISLNNCYGIKEFEVNFQKIIQYLSIIKRRKVSGNVVDYSQEVINSLLSYEESLLRRHLVHFARREAEEAEAQFSKSENILSSITYEEYLGRADERLINISTKHSDEILKLLGENYPNLYKYINSPENWRKEHNKKYIDNQKNKYKVLFDNVEKNPLTDSQREAIIVDEENTLVVASAGSGKTSTIVGKYYYLLERGIKPEEILIVAFNAKVRKELKERIVKGDSNINLENIHTFHSFGKNIIQNVMGSCVVFNDNDLNQAKAEQIGVEDKEKQINGILTNIIDKIFDAFIPSKQEKLKEYFSKKLDSYKSQYDFKSEEEYKKYAKKTRDYVSLVRKDCRGYAVKLKSRGEMLIANFLYLNGVEFEYEQPYDFQTKNASKQHKPDFVVYAKNDKGEKIYIEHWGHDRNENVASWINKETYLQDKKWKEQQYAKDRANLINTYYYEISEETLEENLRKNLENYGIKLNPISWEEFLEQLKVSTQRSQFDSLVKTFLILFKMKQADLQELNFTYKSDEKKVVFLDFFEEVYSEYVNQKGDKYDFIDLITSSTKFIQQNQYQHRYKYILIDEFQDISEDKINLINSLKQQQKIKIMAVGDDWQSIYSFAGSNVKFFSDFGDYFTPYETTHLKETFRFSQEIADISSYFIQQNEKLLKKEILSKKPSTTDYPVRIYLLNQKDKIEAKIKEIKDKIGNSTDANKEDIVVLSRYKDGGQTIHAQKGLEYQFVILNMTNKNKYHRFPAILADDDILYMVKENVNTDEEERRLFYVALTRCKKVVCILDYEGADKQSIFTKELLEIKEFEKYIYSKN